MEDRMDHKLRKIIGATTMAIGLALAAPASAQITGTIEAKLVLTSTCTINTAVFTGTAPHPTATYSALDFGTATTAFAQIDGSTSLSYTCSEGSTPKITLSGGSNPASTDRRMRLGATSHYVSYKLYTDSGRTSEIPLDGVVNLSGNNTATTLTIYGRAFGASGLSVGSYTDLVTVTLAL
jgi:spore coat protein U-like protein